jgi:hypothetical protein
MPVSKQLSLAVAITFVFTCFFMSKVLGDFPEDLRINTNVAWDWGDFSSFSNPTPYSFTSEGLSIDIPSTSLGLGAVAIAPTAEFDLSDLASIEVTARAEVGNQTELILFASSDSDFFIYLFPKNDFIVDQFVTVSLDASDFDPLLTLSNTGVLSGGITNFGFTQAPDSGGSPLEYTVESVNFVTSVPEPSAFPALFLLCGALGIRRNRGSKRVACARLGKWFAACRV